MSALLIVSATAVVSFLAGYSAREYRYVQSKAHARARLDLAQQLTGPLDFALCEASHQWEARR